MHKIAFIDDEPFLCKPFLSELTNVFEVVFFDSASDARSYFDDHLDIMAVVLDVMMPTPKDVPETLTAKGDLTGIWLLEQLSDYIIGHTVPVVILSNKTTDAVSVATSRLDPKVQSLTRAYQKIAVDAAQLAKIVERMIARNLRESS